MTATAGSRRGGIVERRGRVEVASRKAMDANMASQEVAARESHSTRWTDVLAIMDGMVSQVPSQGATRLVRLIAHLT